MNLKIKSYCKRLKNDFDIGKCAPIKFWRCEWEIYTSDGSNVAPSPQHGNKSPVSIRFFLYRLIAFLCSICFCIYDISKYEEIHLFLIYFTNWTLTLQIIYGAVYLLRLIQVWLNHFIRIKNGLGNTTEKDYGTRLEIPEMVLWVLYDSLLTFPFIISLIFSTTHDLPGMKSWSASSMAFFVMSISMVFLGACLVAIPVRGSQCVFPMGLVASYGFFTFAYDNIDFSYSKLNPRLIYPFIDWKNKPLETLGITFCGILLAGFIHFCSRWGFYKPRRLLKKWIFYQRRKQKKKEEKEKELLDKSFIPVTSNTSEESISGFSKKSDSSDEESSLGEIKEIK